jgi:hypothetical protein
MSTVMSEHSWPSRLASDRASQGAGWWHWGALAGLAALATWQVAAADSTFPVEAFKRFISSPPPIEQFMFEFRNVNLAREASNDTVSVLFYDCRWQANAFLMKECHSLRGLSDERITGNDRAMGFFDRDYWIKTPRETMTSRLDVSKGETSGKRPNEVWAVVWGEEQVGLSPAFNLGIRDVRIGGLRWHGNYFTAPAVRGRRTVEGRLTVNRRGEPEIQYAFKQNGTNLNRSVVEYEFGNPNAPAYIPQTMRTFCTWPVPRRRLSAEISVLSLKLGDGPLPARRFAMGLFDNSQAKYMTEVVNGKEIRHELVKEKQLRTTVVFVLVILLLAIPALVVMVRQWRASR